MTHQKLLFLLVTYVALVLADKEERVVRTLEGPVKGFLNEKGYFEFFGIPYAAAPKGEHKFKSPLPTPTRNYVFEATRKVACPQFRFEISNISLLNEVQDEDCLVVNVFVPKTEQKKLPVVVYIHGGAFILGNANMYDHAPLTKQDIIVVNFNYRLGVQGFLCLGTKDIPGNAGMKDQVAALRWVKNNIDKFGGDSDEITIAGYSAGSSSVEYLMLSPATKGLFKRVIAESGSAISPWALTLDPVASARRYMRDVSGRDSDDIVELEDLFKALTSEQLTQLIYFAEPNSTFVFVPCVEPIIEGEESFLNESPLQILKNGRYSKVAIMAGFTTEEGLFRIEQFDDWSARMNINFADFLPQNLVFESEEEKKHVGNKVKKFYFGDGPINIDTIRGYVNYFTDILFSYSIIKAARMHADNDIPIYLYDYSYTVSIASPYAHNDKIRGANHCAQTDILFADTEKLSKNDTLMQNRLVSMWANFIKFGTPIRETSELLPVPWPQLDPLKMNYLHIDLEMKAGERLLEERIKFLDSIYKQHDRQPLAPGHIRTEL